ncbi:hypothetical protein [Nocardia sp. NPDC052112]|uniref:hypothetical protein n=1 Tax=Nocardia sp. NPDC052112 TaxID=3155646 RepID=UPI00342C9796
MAGNRCSTAEFAQHVNAAVELADAGVPVEDATRVLVGRFGCSLRQARRYLARAAVGGELVVREPMVVFTVKVTAALEDRVRERARVSGGTVSAMAVEALTEYLAPDRRSGGR